MGTFFGKLSIRVKLTLITMTACGGAILVACAGFGAYDLLAVRHAMEESMDTHAAIIADNSTAAVSFGNASDAQSILQSLHAEKQIEAAAVYGADDHLLANYMRSKDVSEPPGSARPQGIAFENNYLVVSRPISLDGRRIGSVYIRADLSALRARVRHYTLILLAVMAAATATALLLVFRTQKLITDPILALAQTARDFASTRNYSLRAKNVSEDEVGTLTNTFNEMLDQMQARDAELAAHRDHLEQEVERRTLQLTQLNRQLSLEKDRVEAASVAKSSFLANMSHEIRTPMTAIVGYADLLLEPDQTLSDRQDCLQVIRRNGRHLVDLINDMLDISELLADLISLLRPRATSQGLAFNLQASGEIQVRVQTDALRLRQVLMNLLGNAIKFTQQGEISLTVSFETDGEKPMLRFDIRDSGIGITDEQMSRLFQAFTQADESMTRRFGGTGLGLVISQRLAQLLGGSITAVSKPGMGSTFTVRIDPGSIQGSEMVTGLTESILPKPQVQQIATSIALRGRLLLVEDGPDNQRLISLHLRKAGATVDIADNGRIGVDKIHEAIRVGKPYDLVLMDMQMPELDGYGATSKLRGEGFTTPIIALTAHAMADDREKCLAAGCTDYLTKPIEKSLLLERVASYLAQAYRTQSQQQAASAAAAAVASVTQSTGPLKSTFADDPDMKEVLGEFVSQLPA